MANLIKLRKGLDINLKGKAAAEVVAVKEPGFYTLCPDDFTGVTPKVVVKEQEYVMAEDLVCRQESSRSEICFAGKRRSDKRGTWGKTQGDEHHRAGCYGTGL